MKEREYALPNGSLTYEIRKGNRGEEIVITGFSGLMSSLFIPEEIEGRPVAEIGRKAFLSKKRLRHLCLPSTLDKIDDWAFGYCSGLESVVLPNGPLTLGRAVFLECGNLKKLEVPRDDGENPPAELMAAAVTFFEAYYLVDPVMAGEKEWLSKFDNRMLSYLHTDDHEGYAKQVLCGEEDYGSTDLEAFLNHRRRSKVRLLYLRLLNPIGLAEEVRGELKDYLLAHTKGCPSEEAWEVVREEHGEERRYFELFAELGCLTEESFDAVIQEIGEGCPEMKAYFLRVKEERIGYTDFFEGLALNW